MQAEGENIYLANFHRIEPASEKNVMEESTDQVSAIQDLIAKRNDIWSLVSTKPIYAFTAS